MVKVILLIIVVAFLGAAAQSYFSMTRGPTPVDSAVRSILGPEDTIERVDEEVDRLMDKAKETVDEVVK